MKQSQFIDLKLQFTSMFKMSYHDVMKFLTIIKFFSLGKILLQSMIWQDRNLKFGPNYDLDVDHLARQSRAQFFIFSLQI